MTQTAPEVERRMRLPVAVGFVVGINGVISVLIMGLGVLLIFARYEADNVDDPDRNVVSIIGSVVIILGLGVLALGASLRRGSRPGRIAATVGMGLTTALAIALMLFDGFDWVTLVILVLPLLAIAALWLGPGHRFFARRSAPLPIPE